MCRIFLVIFVINLTGNTYTNIHTKIDVEMRTNTPLYLGADFLIYIYIYIYITICFGRMSDDNVSVPSMMYVYVTFNLICIEVVL